MSPERFVGYDAKNNLVFFGSKATGGSLLGGGYTNTEDCFVVFSPDLKYKDNYPIEIPKLKAGGEDYYTLKNIKNIKCVSLGDSSYIIGSVIGDGGLKFYAWPIDPIKKKLGVAQNIGEIKGVTKLKGETQWTKSPNNTLGLLSADIEQRNDDKEYVHCMIVDQSMQKQSQLKAVVPYDRKDFDFDDITLDDQGKVVVSGQVKIDKAQREDKKVKTEPVLLSFSKMGHQ